MKKIILYICFLGNVPSAITLSYMLAGNTPFYSGNTNDEFLHLRLTENADEPLVLQDLAFLSDVSIFIYLSSIIPIFIFIIAIPKNCESLDLFYAKFVLK